jgi:hypothetical protein
MHYKAHATTTIRTRLYLPDALWAIQHSVCASVPSILAAGRVQFVMATKQRNQAATALLYNAQPQPSKVQLMQLQGFTS